MFLDVGDQGRKFYTLLSTGWQASNSGVGFIVVKVRKDLEDYSRAGSWCSSPGKCDNSCEPVLARFRLVSEDTVHNGTVQSLQTFMKPCGRH